MIGFLAFIPQELITIAKPHAIGVLLWLRERIRLHRGKQLDISIPTVPKIENCTVGGVGHHAAEPITNRLLNPIDHWCQHSGITHVCFALVAQD